MVNIFHSLLLYTSSASMVEGLKLMIFGMTIVFVFLIIMIFVMNFTAKIIRTLHQYFPEKNSKKTSKIGQVVDSYEDIALVIATVKSFLREK